MHAGACGALLRFIQEEEHVMLAAGSLVVATVGLQHHMLIDPGTVQTLELIKQRPGSSPLNAKEGTLFRWLNRTKTLPGARWPPSVFQTYNPPPIRTRRVACRAACQDYNVEQIVDAKAPANLQPLDMKPRHIDVYQPAHQATCDVPLCRLLKANILQPLTDAASLKLRHDAVEEMLGNQELAFNAAQGLAQLPANLDRLCSSLALIPNSTGAVGKRCSRLDCIAACPL